MASQSTSGHHGTETANDTESTRLDELRGPIEDESTASDHEPGAPPKGVYGGIQICGGLDSPETYDN